MRPVAVSEIRMNRKEQNFFHWTRRPDTNPTVLEGFDLISIRYLPSRIFSPRSHTLTILYQALTPRCVAEFFLLTKF